jgi:hypothetical protein
MSYKKTLKFGSALLMVLAFEVLPATLFSQTRSNNAQPTARLVPASTSSRTRRVSPYAAVGLTPGARNYYTFMWGVDSLQTKSAESGQMIRFSFRVLDPEKAKALNDKKSDPFLLDQRAGVKLVVPTMEKIGQLRQSSTPELGKTYWMVFSNKGGHVRQGDRVSVVIGKFRVDGLTVE